MENLEWRKFKVESLKLALDQGDKLLKETLETAAFQVSRVLIILKTSLALIILLLGYVISINNNGIVYYDAVLLLLFSIAVFVFSAKSYKMYNVEPAGNNPFNILTNDSLSYTEDQYRVILYKCCMTIENSIVTNTERNSKRSASIRRLEKIITIGLATIIFYPFSLWLCYLIFGG